jgi:hypothetical protein
LDETGATWIATTDYRTYAMMRWLFRGRVPVIEINERGRFQDFRDPGLDRIKGRAGIYVGREPDNRSSLWENIPAKREPLGQVERRWRGLVMDNYVLEKLSGWTPELSPPKDSPLFQWRVLAFISPQARDGEQSATPPRPSFAGDPSRGPTASAAAVPRTAAAV